MPLDHYVTLGRSGLRVSPLCLGAMTFGTEWDFGCDADQAARILDAYIDRGGNFIDTANIYTKGHAEQIIGDHIGRIPSRRDRLVIATKFGGNLFPGDPNAGGASRKSIHQACRHSLRRLQTDYIDLYLLHFHDPFTPLDETLHALDDLVRAGLVRYIGFSDTPAWVCARAQTIAELGKLTPLIALQIEYSLLERTVEAELIPMACELGLGVTPWAPLKGGILTGKYTRDQRPPPGQARHRPDARHFTERTFQIVDAVVEIARELGSTPARVALAWVMARPGVASTIVGARTVAQLQDTLDAVDLRLEPRQLQRLDDVSRPDLPFPNAFLQRVAAPIMQGGTTINGRRSEPWPLAPASDAERY